jgi:hypothetical protein
MAFEDIKPYVDTFLTKLDMDVVNGVHPDYDNPPWDAEEKTRFVRGFRNSWLASTDWTVGNDSPLSDEDKQAWTTYRQELRDMLDVDDIENVVIPTPPDIYIIHPEYLEPE